MVLHVSLGSFVGMIPSVKRVPSCGMCMMGCLFVLSALVMLSCFGVVTRGVRMVLRRLLMMLGCFLGHRGFLCLARYTSSGDMQRHIGEGGSFVTKN